MPSITRRTATVELADGQIVEARITNPDTLRYEATAQRHGWPAALQIKDGVGTIGDVNRKTTFEAWAALKRAGAYEGTWEAFEKTDCVDLSVEEEKVDPTHPAAEADSSPNSHGTDDAPSDQPTPPEVSPLRMTS